MIHVNEYFDGAVKSLAYENDGKSTVGVLEEGEYQFGTSTPEVMRVIEGEILALLPNKNDWESYTEGQEFDVPANSNFKVRVSKATSYLCKYK